MSALLRISGNKASPIKTIGLIVGPLLFIYFQFFTNLNPEQPAVSATLAVVIGQQRPALPTEGARFAAKTCRLNI